MERSIHLNAATAEHYQFALELYLLTMRPYTQELMVWDEAKQRASFATLWKLSEVRIVAVDGREVGWLQVQESPTDVHLLQFFIAPDQQGSGIGTEVLRSLLPTWRAMAKPVLLTVLKNNPARRLYERLGFSVVGDSGVKYEMKLNT
ncbi:GNAT family N-acetyltransferase [Bradyrhizobium manausense]|uniref:GNAT family N-acetyltransferase n=1 Tax=Bradyrhizobium manausense TaxID=989370 RepID=UPI001BAB035C|nr:GNAT family N-acetyltransferase [Bradyrhizobium manausense]MBR0689074.1 GNAT family N-acetyltransferase [Bradyrhizobium manausense]